MTFDALEPRKSVEAGARSIVAANKSYHCYSPTSMIESNRIARMLETKNFTDDQGKRESSRAQQTSTLTTFVPSDLQACHWHAVVPERVAPTCRAAHHEGAESGTIPPDCHSKTYVQRRY